MRLPDSFLDDLRARLSLSQVVGRKVTWDMKKTNQARGDWWAPCPFHQEKSPSFHVDDGKGFYYCFGCQAKGNLFGFVQETENVGFMEAVEMLAAEAGMEMPARDPKAAEISDRRGVLAEATEAAARWFRLQLATKAAAGAREYLAGRGLTEATQDTFGVGFAPDAGDALLTHLLGRGTAWDVIADAGLALEEDGRRRDRFIARIVFPIRDARGRCIGFGGRAMNPNAKAKYLNSPETALFDKGANLYNLGPARAAAGKGQPLVVAEGYMDVIALHQAGFEAAVAPLGTAVTERQLRLLWRVSPEPLIALDGDAAGQKAGLRVADLALPLMAAGQSLRFAILPEGRDPDDVIRDGGADAMRAVLDAARPAIALLWRRETEGRSFDSPERRATLDRDLRALLGRIDDRALRRHYGDEFARLRADLFGIALAPPAPAPASDPGRRRDGWPPRPFVPGRRWTPPPAPASNAARASVGATGRLSVDEMLEQVALGCLARHPSLVQAFSAELEAAEWSRDRYRMLAAALLRQGTNGDSSNEPDIRATLDLLANQNHLGSSVRQRDDVDAARSCVARSLGMLAARHGADRERAEALEDFASEVAGEALTWRLAQAARRRDVSSRAATIVPEASEDESSMSEHLQSLLDTRAWEKTKKK